MAVAEKLKIVFIFTKDFVISKKGINKLAIDSIITYGITNNMYLVNEFHWPSQKPNI